MTKPGAGEEARKGAVVAEGRIIAVTTVKNGGRDTGVCF